MFSQLLVQFLNLTWNLILVIYAHDVDAFFFNFLFLFHFLHLYLNALKNKFYIFKKLIYHVLLNFIMILSSFLMILLFYLKSTCILLEKKIKMNFTNKYKNWFIFLLLVKSNSLILNMKQKLVIEPKETIIRAKTVNWSLELLYFL